MMDASNQWLRNELLEMAKEDQRMRTKVIKGAGEWDSSVDKHSQSRLKLLVEEYGWPTVSKVGAEASQAAWLLVQHAPDLKFMEYCLDLMEDAPPGDVKPANIAYLKDRVLVLNDKPQIYGTQFQGTGTAMHVYPIDDMEHLDERRARMGLGSFSEYEARLRALYNADD